MTHNTPVETVLQRLYEVTGHEAKRCGQNWQSRCPAHDDRDPSLSVAEGDDGRALLKCHAGCTTDVIVSALRLTLADLMPSRNGDSPARKANTPKTTARVDFAARAASYTAALSDDVLWRLSESLGVSSTSLQRLGIGWSAQHDAYTFPMSDADGKVIGIRTRSADGLKKSVIGSKSGLFIPSSMASNGPQLIAEGPTDAASLLDLGFDAIGRPSATSGGEMVKRYCRRHRRHDVVLVADNDANGTGRKGAQSLAKLLDGCCESVRMIFPPDGVKDAREWRKAGAVRDEIDAAIDAAEPVVAEESRPVRAVVVSLSEVESRPVDWLWPDRIALGKVTNIAGDPGLGKSFLTLALAAKVSTGEKWPDCDSLAPCGDVVLLSAEDDLEDTIRPRLDAAGADVSRIVALQAVELAGGDEDSAFRRCFDLERDVKLLEETVASRLNCKLVVIDPITAYLGQKDSHNSGDVRGLLAPLVAMAARHQVAVVMVTHLNKAAGGPAMYRSIGSISFVGAARSAWIVGKDKSDEARRLFLPLKNNLAENKGGLAFTLSMRFSLNGQPVVAWDADPVMLTADEALGNQRQQDGHRAIDEAGDWLREMLASGPMPVKLVQAEAKDSGLSWATVRRAKDKLGVVVKKSGFGDESHWAWALPAVEDAQTAEDAQPDDVSTFVEVEHLRVSADAVNEVLAEAAAADDTCSGANLGVESDDESEDPF